MLKRIIEILNNLSLDVAAGAAASTWLAGYVLGYPVPAPYYLLLLLAVWWAYTTDHLADVCHSSRNLTARRRVFHQRHFKTLLFICAATGMAGLLLGILIGQPDELLTGITIAVIIVIYFLLLKIRPSLFRKVIPKELVVVMIYLSGTWGIPLIHRNLQLSLNEWLLIASFGLVAFANAWLLSYVDKSEDKADGHNSTATAIDSKRHRLFFFTMTGLAMLFSTFIVLFSSDLNLNRGGKIVMLQALVLALIAGSSGQGRSLVVQRFKIEAVMWLPAILWVV
ncbi:MAG: hypothetical protein Kow00127_18230 [Bacteroidales bacterium]